MSEGKMKHQAHKLDEIMESQKEGMEKRETKLIAITSGKGGVGKTTLSANLGYTLWKLGFKVGMFDADIGLANLDVILGVKTDKNILDVIQKKARLDDIIVPVEEGLYLIPGESGEEILKYSDDEMVGSVFDESEILDDLDFLLIDTGAGIGGHIQKFLSASDEVVVVTVPDPAAITDAYATIKITSKTKSKIYLIINMVRSAKEADDVFKRIKKVASVSIGKWLRLSLLGKINQDSYITKSTKTRTLLAREQPAAAPSLDIEDIALKLAESVERKVLQQSDGRLGRFFKRIMGQF